MTLNVILAIVKNELCIGCGVCAAICPEQSLEMRFNSFGEYNPFQHNECTKECGLCLKVCPFADGNPNEDIIGQNLYGNVPGIQHNPETGYYLDTYVGFAQETRERGASGGMATWLLSMLLKKGIVDYIIAVVPNDDTDRLFKYSIMFTPESVLASAGSAYYPVELSEVLKEIQKKPGKCAIIGLPCFIKALRLVTQKNRKLKERIFVTLGIVCGQLKSKHYTEYIAALSGVFPPLRAVYYRGKSLENPVNNYYFSCENQNGDRGKIFWNGGVAEAWTNRWFTPNSCNYCDDIFAECADVTFMDAWLPEYLKDNKGTSLIVVRSPLIQEIISNGLNSRQISLNHIPIQEIVRSQNGVIQVKKNQISYRLYMTKNKNHRAPMKRVLPRDCAFYPILRKEIELKEEMRSISRNSWIAKNNREIFNQEEFKKTLDPYLFRLKKWEQISRFISLPSIVLRFVPMKIRSYLYG